MKVFDNSKLLRTTKDFIRSTITGGSFIAGEFKTIAVPLNVYEVETGALVGVVENSSPEVIKAAVDAAQASLQSTWVPWKRQESLYEAASMLDDIQEQVASLIATEGIKTITEARQEVERAIHTLKLSASSIDSHIGESLNLQTSYRGEGRTGYFERQPLGIVGAITPFNDPLNLVAHKIGPALAAGNAVVLKPAEQTPFSALLLVSLLHDAGVPPGRVGVLPGNAKTGQSLVADRRVDVITFTGGQSAGTQVSSESAGRKVLLELGGNNAVVVAGDCRLHEAARACVRGAFSAAGQNCLSVQRVYVQEEVIDRFTFKAVEIAQQMSVDTKFNEASDMGPLVNREKVATLKNQIDNATADGAVVEFGGTSDGPFFAPTIMTSVNEDSDLFCSEVFGPVLLIVPYSDSDTLPRRINEAGQPMQVGIFASDIQLCMRLANEVQAGTVLINESSDFRSDSMPFGSFGRSGIGREGIKYAMQELSAPKSIIFTSSFANHAY